MESVSIFFSLFTLGRWFKWNAIKNCCHGISNKCLHCLILLNLLFKNQWTITACSKYHYSTPLPPRLLSSLVLLFYLYLPSSILHILSPLYRLSTSPEPASLQNAVGNILPVVIKPKPNLLVQQIAQIMLSFQMQLFNFKGAKNFKHD